MEIVLIVLILFVAVLLTIIVLVQNSKGGGLATNVGISSSQFGVKKTSDFLEKLTWGLAIALVVLSLSINLLIDRDGQDVDMPGSINVEKARESRNVPQIPQQTQPQAEPAAPAPEGKPEEGK